MNDESKQIPEKLPPGELVGWLRHDSWTRDDAMMILMGINPDRTAIAERQTDYGRLEWKFEADGPSMMGGYDQTPPRAEIRRLAERLTAMMDTWNSGNHPAFCSPDYYIKWAVAHGFEVPWLEPAHSIGLINAVQQTVMAEDTRKKWEIPERLEYKAREIGEAWMNEQSVKPGVDAIAKHVEQELKDRDERGPRGDYWDWQTIKKEALAGITGRKRTGNK